MYPYLVAAASGTLVYHVSPAVLDYVQRRFGITDRAERWMIVAVVNVVLSVVFYALIVGAGFEVFTAERLLQCALASFATSQAWWAKAVRGEPVVDKEQMATLLDVDETILANANRHASRLKPR